MEGEKTGGEEVEGGRCMGESDGDSVSVGGVG